MKDSKCKHEYTTFISPLIASYYGLIAMSKCRHCGHKIYGNDVMHKDKYEENMYQANIRAKEQNK